MEVMGQPADELAKAAAQQLWEDLSWYWPAFGGNGIGESNAVAALIRVLQKRSICEDIDRHPENSRFSFQAYTEVPSTPLLCGKDQGGPTATHRRLDLVVTGGCNENLEGMLLVEAKRLHDTSTADSLIRDIHRINEFSFIEENNHGAGVFEKLDRNYGLVVALTCDDAVASWWGHHFDLDKKDSPARIPDGKRAASWARLGDALSNLEGSMGGVEEFDLSEIFNKCTGYEYFLYAFFPRPLCAQ